MHMFFCTHLPASSIFYCDTEENIISDTHPRQVLSFTWSASLTRLPSAGSTPPHPNPAISSYQPLTSQFSSSELQLDVFILVVMNRMLFMWRCCHVIGWLYSCGAIGAVGLTSTCSVSVAEVKVYIFLWAQILTLCVHLESNRFL